MQSRGWHDLKEPHDLERVADNEGKDALVEAESGGERVGMRRRRIQRAGAQGRERNSRTMPPGKGLSKRPAAKRGKAGAKRAATATQATKASKAKSGTRKKAAPKGPRRV
jgi:hypothetical protein